MIKVYTASKLKYAAKFRELRAQWRPHGIDVHARWLEQVQHEDSATPEDFHVFWLVDEEDVRTSQACVVYGVKGDELRGALVEAGIAIACGIMTIVIGDAASFGTWQHHPHVVRADDFDHALAMLQRRFRT